MKFLIPLLLILFLVTEVPVFSEVQSTDDDSDLIQERIEKRSAKKAKGNTLVAGIEQLNTPFARKRKKGALVFALDADQQGNSAVFMKANKSKKVGKAEFFGPFFFMPQDFIATGANGSTSINLVDDQGNDVKIAAKNNEPIFVVNGTEISLKGQPGPQGATGAPGAPGLSGALTTAANITSNTTGDPVNDDLVFGSSQLIDQGGTNDDKRMFFDKSQAAFRVGEAQGTQWNSPGLRSAAFGLNNTASADNSMAGGQLSTASGQNAIAFGSFATASGFGSAAFGQSANAGGSSSIAIGSSTSTSASESFACCLSSSAFNGGSIVLGAFVNSAANRAITIGEGISGGQRLINSTPNSLMIGFRSDVPTLFVGPGDGTSGSVGNIGFGTSTPGRNLHVVDTMRIEPRSSAPSGGVLGDIYVDSDSNTFCFHNGTSFQAVSGPGPCS